MTALGLFLLWRAGTAASNRAHEELEASRAQTRSLVEQAPDGIFVADIDGRYTDVNDAGCRMLGYSREEFVGKTIVDLIPADESSGCGRRESSSSRVAARSREWTLRARTGATSRWRLSAKILPDGRWQGFVRDISERKRRESEQRFLAEFGIGAVIHARLRGDGFADRRGRVKDLADLCMVDPDR